MHTALQLLALCSLAFVTLCVALVLLNIYDGVIGNDLTLHSAGKEAAIAGVAALVEGAGLWIVVYFGPVATRALVVPALIVALIYKVGHLEDWSKGDVLMLLVFQLAIAFFAALLIGGQFQAAVLVLLVFAACLAAIASFAKNL
ncbi:MAG: hypothetical protein ABSA47_12265 [Verrucomicrobiota bacterium]|jgi:hypothetical protein